MSDSDTKEVDNVRLAVDVIPIPTSNIPENNEDEDSSNESKPVITDLGEEGTLDNLDFPLVDKESGATGARARAHTEKGSGYRIERLQFHHRAAMSSWRKQAAKLEGLFTDCDNPKEFRVERDQLNTAMKMIENTLAELQLEGAHEEWMQKMEDIEDKHLELMKQIGEHVRLLSDGESVYSRRSQRSVRSTHLRSSSILEQKATLAAEAASLRVKLARETELSKIKANFDRLKLEEELEMAEARLQAVADIETDVLDHNLKQDADKGAAAFTPSTEIESKFHPPPLDVKPSPTLDVTTKPSTSNSTRSSTSNVPINRISCASS